MACVAVVVFNVDCVGFADNMSLRRQDFCEGVPCVGVESAACKVFYFVIESSKCCSITTAEHPCHSSPRATVNGFDNPKFVFFDLTKCHISSNSICVISPGTSGSGRVSPKSRIQRYTNVWSIFKMRPIIRYEPFAIA